MAIGGRAAAAAAEFDVRDQVIAFKRKLAPRREALQRAFADVRDHVRDRKPHGRSRECAEQL